MEHPRRLSAAFVQTITTPGRYGDGRGGFGLSLLVKDTTTGRVSRSWSQRFRADGQLFQIGLGSFPKVTLSEARKRALANSRIAEAGGNPRRQPNATPTFEQSMERAISVLRPGWKSEKTERQLRYLLGEYAVPEIGKKPIDSIMPADVLAFLSPLAMTKPSTAKKLRTQLSQVFKWSIAQGLRSDNPADSNISAGLPRLATKDHHKALPFGQVADALKTIRGSGAWLGTKLAFEFLVLTAGRSGEVRAATWDEIDLDNATWTIPAARMKSSREHRVPLSGAALAVLESARQLSDGSGLVFPSSTGRALTDSTISKLLRENGVKAVPHGFRSSFRDWAASANIPRQTAEASLAHVVGDATEAAYLRSDLFELRRGAMESWSRFLTLNIDS